jgi:hypothetical protein
MSKPSFEQATAFFRYLVGFKGVGIPLDEGSAVPFSPEVLAFLEGMIPTATVSAYAKDGIWADRRYAMTDAIRDLCDAFDAGPGK